jgi:Ser/Thr protein kinase RdoA (MazF antagonist)
VTASERLITDDFYSLTPDKVLDAVESYGYRCTGRCLALNSLENRVYEIEVEGDSRFLVAKFYRPLRWSKDQIQEEHDFLHELASEDLPVVAPIKNSNDQTIYVSDIIGCYGALFPKRSGRMEPESSASDLERIGRTLARVHQVGSRKPFLHRQTMSPSWYLEYHRESVDAFLPSYISNRYQNCITTLRQAWESLPLFPNIRLHGDCHRGNILWREEEGPLLVDFDDSIMGPMIQDVWLLFHGRINDYQDEFASFLKGYELFLDFDDRQLKAVELIRAFRMVQYAGWIAKRWDDPSFKMAFPQFLEDLFWESHVSDIEDQCSVL